MPIAQGWAPLRTAPKIPETARVAAEKSLGNRLLSVPSPPACAGGTVLGKCFTGPYSVAALDLAQGQGAPAHYAGPARQGVMVATFSLSSHSSFRGVGVPPVLSLHLGKAQATL